MNTRQHLMNLHLAVSRIVSRCAHRTITDSPLASQCGWRGLPVDNGVVDHRVSDGGLEGGPQLQAGSGPRAPDQHTDEAGHPGVRGAGSDLVDRGVHGGIAQRVFAHVGGLRSHGLLLGIIRKGM